MDGVPPSATSPLPPPLGEVPQSADWGGEGGSPVFKILALQSDINRDIDSLVDLKAEITRRIRRLSKPEYQTVLELRYLCFLTWDEIILQMRYARRHVFRLHKEALEELESLRSRPP